MAGFELEELPLCSNPSAPLVNNLRQHGVRVNLDADTTAPPQLTTAQRCLAVDKIQCLFSTRRHHSPDTQRTQNHGDTTQRVQTHKVFVNYTIIVYTTRI